MHRILHGTKSSYRLHSAHERRRFHIKRSGFRQQNFENGIVIIHDPLPAEEGGYSMGATFHSEDKKEMCRLNCFTPGTILIEAGIRKVVRKIGEYQELIPLLD